MNRGYVYDPLRDHGSGSDLRRVCGRESASVWTRVLFLQRTS